jgi:hypothetical protein
MLYFLSRLGDALKRGLAAAGRTPTQESDPIDHPEIAAMSLGELADLPLRPDPIPTLGFRQAENAQAARAGPECR